MSLSIYICTRTHTDSSWPLLSTWLTWQFTNQPTICALLLILPFSVFPLCSCTRLVGDLFFHLSGNSLARLDHQTHSPLLNVFEILPLKLSCWLCVCVCLQKFVLTVFCSLLYDGLCAPIWRNSTRKSASLLSSVVCVPKYIYSYA